MSQIVNAIFSAAFVTAVIRLTTPILLSALGDIYCERTGVLNIAQEGMMLIGAFCAFLGGYYANNPYAGFLAALAVGAVLGAFYAVFVVTLGCNQVVTCLGVNMLGIGLTSTLYKYLFGITTAIPQTGNMPTLWFGQSSFFYLALLIVPITYVILQKTKWGLKLRAIGEYPRAAATVGVDVYRHRYIACVISGMLAALGGASLTIGGLGYFQENMVAGRGFIAFAAVIFGRYSPLGTLVACLIFGSADALQLTLQSLGFALPYHLFLMLPYVVTILVLVLFGRKSFVPRAQGMHYVRTER